MWCVTAVLRALVENIALKPRRVANVLGYLPNDNAGSAEVLRHLAACRSRWRFRVWQLWQRLKAGEVVWHSLRLSTCHFVICLRTQHSVPAIRIAINSWQRHAGKAAIWIVQRWRATNRARHPLLHPLPDPAAIRRNKIDG